MNNLSEKDQTATMEYEPSTEAQRIKNISNYTRLTNIVPMPYGEHGNRADLFTKPDDPRQLLIANLLGNYGVRSVSITITEERTDVTYFFFNNGSAAKQIEGEQQQHKMSPLNPAESDYETVDDALVSVEGKEFKSKSTKLF